MSRFRRHELSDLGGLCDSPACMMLILAAASVHMALSVFVVSAPGIGSLLDLTQNRFLIIKYLANLGIVH